MNDNDNDNDNDDDDDNDNENDNDNDNDNENDNENTLAITMAEKEKQKTARNFRTYKVWQDSVAFATKVYSVTNEMPWFEKMGLCDQLQRAAVSISSNIAEGCARPSDNDFAHFLDVALGSCYEVETQLIIAKNVGYIQEMLYNELLDNLQNIEKQMAGLIGKVRQR